MNSFSTATHYKVIYGSKIKSIVRSTHQDLLKISEIFKKRSVFGYFKFDGFVIENNKLCIRLSKILPIDIQEKLR